MNSSQYITCFGELLLRFNTQAGMRFIQSSAFDIHVGGAEANVAVLLAQLGQHSRMVSHIPDNHLSQLAVGGLRKYGVDTSFITTGGERLGTYYVENGNHLRPTQVIYDRAGSSFAGLQPGDINWQQIFQSASLFHWSGVSAALSASATAVCEEAIKAAIEQGIPISADFNYRRKLWNYGQAPDQVMPALLHHSEIAVADLDAAAVYFDIKTDESLPLKARFQQCFQQLKSKMPKLKTFAMSFRVVNGLHHEYFGAIAHEDKYYYSELHSLPLVTDQIGTGDAFTAGLLYGISSALDPQQMINWATACGVLKQSIHGDWALISNAEIEAFIANGISSRINR